MFGYRCYFFDPDWQILGLRDFYAGADAEAIGMARAFSTEQKPHGFELWQGMRQVHRQLHRGDIEDAIHR